MTCLITEVIPEQKSPAGLLSSPMDDLTRYVVAGLIIILAWFSFVVALGYTFYRHVERRKRLFRGHDTETDA